MKKDPELLAIERILKILISLETHSARGRVLKYIDSKLCADWERENQLVWQPSPVPIKTTPLSPMCSVGTSGQGIPND